MLLEKRFQECTHNSSYTARRNMTNDIVVFESCHNILFSGDDNELFNENITPINKKKSLKNYEDLISVDRIMENEKRKNELICEEILEKLGSYNPYSLFIMISMAILWALAAMNLMISAFIVDLTYANTSSNNIIDTFQLIEDKSYLVNMFSSSFMFGSVIGGIVIPIFADYFGRKTNVGWCTFILGAAGCGIAFVNKYYHVLILRFIQGVAFHGTIATNWVLSYESVSIKIRSFSALIFGVIWVVGYCVIAPLAYYFTDWRDFCFFTALPTLIFSFIVFATIPESLGFLIYKKRMDDIKKWLKYNKKFSKFFGKKNFIDIDNLINSISNNTNESRIEDTEKLSIIRKVANFFTTKKILFLNLIIFAFVWTTDTVIYYALSFFSTNLSGNMYINYVLSGLVECPSYLVVPFFLDYFGRKGLTFIMHFIASIALFLGLIIGQDQHIIYLLIWLTGKFCISCTFTSIFVYGSEIFPTSYRNVLLGFCAVISRFGGIIAPFSKSLDVLWPKASIALFASIALLAALLSLILPETGKIKTFIRKKK
ncbi:Solute carrier family 22 member 13 [Strongyloides ratti]|uniref:Solute carrier family 22 member 13 n=1 Tax=Strongyloides ratti TaxID=34506 RepID=A0A090L5A4_STRRB|nr:Solute carrier family 22 member 13 [Strongyloides ratti]CEF64907.1 Solute carrier family 22 member 13 [Strongyloides ratti]